MLYALFVTKAARIPSTTNASVAELRLFARRWFGDLSWVIRRGGADDDIVASALEEFDACVAEAAARSKVDVSGGM